MSKKLSKSHEEAWRLFITANARLVNLIDRKMGEEDQVPLHWYDVLIELFQAPEQRLRMHDLAERVVLSRSGLTRLVDRLEQADLLRREIDPHDRRGFYAILTEQGASAIRQGWSVYAEGIQELFGQHLTTDEAKILIRLFTKMLAITEES